MLDGEAELNELGSFRRYGLVDMVMLYWQEIGADTLAENPDYFQRAAADENIWFVQGKYFFGLPQAPVFAARLASAES